MGATEVRQQYYYNIIDRWSGHRDKSRKRMADSSDSEPEDKKAPGAVDIGFAEYRTHPRGLLRVYFPCKLGGKPAWLNPRDLPKPGELLCASCSLPMLFLIQVYAPIRANARTFHRTIFVFICKNGSCLHRTGSVKVFRSQLPRSNQFYSYEPPPALQELDAAESEDDCDDSRQEELYLEDTPWPNVRLCTLCGASGGQTCGRCRCVHYCSKFHQTQDWKLGHSLECKTILARQAAESKLQKQPTPKVQEVPVQVPTPSINKVESKTAWADMVSSDSESDPPGKVVVPNKLSSHSFQSDAATPPTNAVNPTPSAKPSAISQIPSNPVTVVVGETWRARQNFLFPQYEVAN